MSPVAAAGPPHSRSTFANGGGPISTMNGSTGDGMDGRKGTSRIFPHLDDLTSVQPVVNINSPIRRILQDAELLAKQADTHLDFRRPDIALQEFIKASILATDIIPRHKDFPSMSGSQSELNRSYMGLLKRIKAQQGRFEEARRFIKEDNEKSGVLPVSSGGANGHIQSTNGTSAISNGTPTQNHMNGTSNPPSGSASGPTARKKTPIQPKPDALHGKAIQPLNTTTSTPEQTDLASRFARLRTPVQDPRIRTQPISIPKQPEYTTKSPNETNPAPYPTTVRPLGPREMPSVPTASPRHTRLPLDVQVPGMPQPPAAIYSPSRNPDTAATINLPSSIPRSSSYVGNGNNTAPPVSTVGRTPSFDARQDYFSPAHKISDNNPPKQDFTLPDSTTVSANDLTKYLRVGSQKLRILLVDVRSREEFDEGHILSPYIICMEPVILRDGISSEELVESLVLSPDSEQRLYEQRHEFDLVVFYDQHSSSVKSYSHQASDTSYLQNFAKAMYEYGYDKQLKRRPMLLLGGLDAWVDLMGQSSLQSSLTSSLSSKKSSGNAMKSARPLGRVPMAREPYRFPALRKRTYESRPLSKEEESKWDETLKEHPTAESPTAVEQDASDELSYVRTTEDFFRRYPELPSIQESMISARPAPQISAYRNQLINSIPEPPARPAPALPRQRSSGVLEKTPIATFRMSSGIDKGISNPNSKCGLTGLQNSGVTCYALAIVQCLSATGPLREYLIHFTPGPNTAVPKKASESTDPPQLLVRNFGNLLGHMWSGMYDFVAPVTFMSYINAIHLGSMPRKSPKNQAFGGYARQHDASEFLEYFLSVLHDETNRHRNKPDYQAQIIALRPKDLPEDKKDDWDDDVNLSSVNTQVLMLQEWRRLVNSDDSVISRMFHGQEAWLTRCTVPTCGFTVKRFRSLPMLHLIFPVDVITGTSKRSSISLMEMMRTTVNTSQELAGFNEGYKCKKCGTNDVCWQTRTITYFPDYFIVTIMRFAADYNDDYVAGSVPDMAKITLPVKFTETMDLSQLFIPLGPPPPGGIELERGQVGPFVYDCYGVAIHSGNTLQSGHYVAMTRSLDKPGLEANTWHKFDDRVVRPTNFSESQLPNTHVTQIFMKRRQQA